MGERRLQVDEKLGAAVLGDGVAEWGREGVDGAAFQATGGNFSALRQWDDERWDQVKQLIRSTNEKDRAQRTV